MAITISDTEPRVQYTATAGQTSFSVPFEFFTNADIKVYNATTLLSYNASPSSASQYSVSGAGVSGGGSITLGGSGATLNDVITIYRDLAIARSTDFPTSGAFQINSLNDELDKIIAMCQQLERDLKFSPKAAATTSNTFNITFPNLSANKVLSVNSAGTGLEFAQDITDITTIAAIAGDVTAVSNIAADVTAVANDASDIGVVATNIASINTVSTNIADVITVANDLNEAISEVETVADDLNEAVSEIDTVSNNIAVVQTVGAAANIANISNVAGQISPTNNIATVASANANITTVAGQISPTNNISTLATISSDITQAATDSADIQTVASDSADIRTLADIEDGTVATNAVSNAGNNSTNITTVAGQISPTNNIATVAGANANISTVASNLSGTNTIGTVAGSIANVNLTGGSIANVNEVANNIGTVNNFGERYRVGSTNPTTNNDEGDLFYNTTDDTFYVWTGSTWEAITDRAEALQAIATTKSDTAVDVFIYDTRKDSDGGAWRKRTQNTSWYNETLNTATRGSRKEFPAVAVIVAESNQVTIYDGDDPSLPMWMVFNNGGTSITNISILGRAVDVNTTVTMLNGILFVGNSNYFATNIAFISENVIDYIGQFGAAAGPFRYKGNILQRNAGLGKIAIAGNPIIASPVNDVAMTVLPNAPIDNDTGLPVPTIAVATEGGVSVIKDDGTVVDITATSYTSSSSVNFLDDFRLIYNLGTTNDFRFFHVDTIPSTDFLASSTGYTKGNSEEFYSSDDTSGRGQDLFLSREGSPSIELLLNAKNAFGGKTTTGLTILNQNPATPSEGMVSYITSDYNTGWMNGDIKLATLSDTDDTTITGSELITNGNFSTGDLTGWIDGTGESSVISGELNFLKTTGSWGAINSDNFTTEVGKTYVVTYDVTAHSGNAVRITARTSTGGNIYVPPYHGVGSFSFSFTATTTSSKLTIGTVNAATVDAYFDNITCREAVPDRSVNNKGLQVFGTIAKTPVATGADLVIYGAFTAGNYLYNPNTDAVNFGTGDFTVAFWIKTTDGYGTIITSPSLVIGVYPFVAGEGNIYLAGGKGNTSIIDNIYHQCIVTRRSGVVYFYLDGVLDGTHNNASNYTDTEFKIGVRYDNAQNLTGYLALLRISHTGITAEQVAKIYNDEKFLFQENAKATLYGTSNAVTALAYDDTTKLLHAGTSSGRSVFNGLRRVDNTTDAVGTSISASNGLVVDE